jgi:hypothetical protein
VCKSTSELSKLQLSDLARRNALRRNLAGAQVRRR